MKIKQTLVKPVRLLSLLLVTAAIYAPANLTASNNKTPDTPKEKIILSSTKQKKLNKQFLNAVRNNQSMGTIKKLVKKKHADINAQDYRGRTALHKYIEVDNVEMVAWLIKKGAILIKDKSGKTAKDLIRLRSEVESHFDNKENEKQLDKNKKILEGGKRKKQLKNLNYKFIDIVKNLDDFLTKATNSPHSSKGYYFPPLENSEPSFIKP